MNKQSLTKVSEVLSVKTSEHGETERQHKTHAKVVNGMRMLTITLNSLLTRSVVMFGLLLL